jgi:cyclopropane fatty-acyl-phospholipid synthase-like methyltransferase
MKKWIYELFYRLPFIPISWIFGSPHEMKEYTDLFESGQIPPGRAIDLGCGEGSNAIYLSKNGFEVTGLDFSPTGIKRAHANAHAAGLEVSFFEDDLTNLRHVSGKFDLLVDFGALNDLNQVDRDLYMNNVLPLTNPGSRYILLCFQKSLPANEIERRFAQHFNIETLNKRSESVTARSIVAYCMTRN